MKTRAGIGERRPESCLAPRRHPAQGEKERREDARRGDGSGQDECREARAEETEEQRVEIRSERAEPVDDVAVEELAPGERVGNDPFAAGVDQGIRPLALRDEPEATVEAPERRRPPSEASAPAEAHVTRIGARHRSGAAADWSITGSSGRHGGAVPEGIRRRLRIGWRSSRIHQLAGRRRPDVAQCPALQISRIRGGCAPRAGRRRDEESPLARLDVPRSPTPRDRADAASPRGSPSSGESPARTKRSISTETPSPGNAHMSVPSATGTPGRVEPAGGSPGGRAGAASHCRSSGTARGSRRSRRASDTGRPSPPAARGRVATGSERTQSTNALGRPGTRTRPSSGYRTNEEARIRSPSPHREDRERRGPAPSLRQRSPPSRRRGSARARRPASLLRRASSMESGRDLEAHPRKRRPGRRHQAMSSSISLISEEPRAFALPPPRGLAGRRGESVELRAGRLPLSHHPPRVVKIGAAGKTSGQSVRLRDAQRASRGRRHVLGHQPDACHPPAEHLSRSASDSAWTWASRSPGTIHLPGDVADLAGPRAEPRGPPPSRHPPRGSGLRRRRAGRFARGARPSRRSASRRGRQPFRRAEARPSRPNEQGIVGRSR